MVRRRLQNLNRWAAQYAVKSICDSPAPAGWLWRHWRRLAAAWALPVSQVLQRLLGDFFNIPSGVISPKSLRGAAEHENAECVDLTGLGIDSDIELASIK
jgi:hypothetical protein